MPIGKLEIFEIGTHKWDAYCRRVKQFITLNIIANELQVAVLVTHVGVASYELMCDLCAPELRENKEFDVLVKIVQDHLEPQREDGNLIVRENLVIEELIAEPLTEPKIIGETKAHRLYWLVHLETMGEDLMAPLPPPVWLHPLNATDMAVICPQASLPGLENLKLSMQENCLIANVYIPDSEEKNMSVVVYVHGGAYQIGWGNTLVPKKLIAENNIISVTFNYRLGIHGFLCLGTEDAPGNAGMKDQVELLRWVKKNIANFGGNPDDVTIAGFSAGSASVDLLMLSKSAEGLFTKVIPESGVATSVCAIQYDPLENAKWFAKENNLTNVDNIYALEEFYKTAPFETLIQSAFFDRTDSTFVFTPCVERRSKEAFLTESPIDILKNGNYKKVPLLYGFSNMEGLLRIDFYDSWKHRMNEKFSDFLPADMTFENEKQKEEVAKTVKEFYFDDKPVDDDNVVAYVDFFSDVLFAYSTLRSVRMMVEKGHDEIYLYEYSFVDENTPVVPHTNVKGANHCAQSIAVAGYMAFGDQAVKPTEEFEKTSSVVRQLWAYFIKTGKPVPDGSALPAWGAVQGEWAPHMSLGAELQQRGSLLPRRARFWDQLYDKYYRNPSPPSHTPASHVDF